MFRDRREAGERLAPVVAELGRERPLVLALPRGGVPVAARVAEGIGAPLDIVVVRKIGAPSNPEAAIGAVAADGPALFDEGSLRVLGLHPRDLSEKVEAAQSEARRRLTVYREGAPEPEVGGRDVIAVDDGLATGLSARAALTALRNQDPASLTLAVPVGEWSAVRSLPELCDQVVCLETPPAFQAVSLWYASFPQVSDEEVRELLRGARRGESAAVRGERGAPESGGPPEPA